MVLFYFRLLFHARRKIQGDTTDLFSWARASWWRQTVWSRGLASCLLLFSSSPNENSNFQCLSNIITPSCVRVSITINLAWSQSETWVTLYESRDLYLLRSACVLVCCFGHRCLLRQCNNFRHCKTLLPWFIKIISIRNVTLSGLSRVRTRFKLHSNRKLLIYLENISWKFQINGGYLNQYYFIHRACLVSVLLRRCTFGGKIVFLHHKKRQTYSLF